MPIPFMDDDWFDTHCIGWEQKLSVWPRRCFYTNRSLWFKRAYKGTSMLTGPGEPIFEYRWVDSKEFLLLTIKGEI